MKGCVIFNPFAKGTRGRQFLKFLSTYSQEFVLWPTDRPGHARELARDAVAAGFDILVAAGGDGTVNEVINGIGSIGAFAQIRFAVIPIGTVNVFARELCIPFDVAKACSIVFKGKEARIDLGQAQQLHGNNNVSHYFAQLAGAGFDSQSIRLVKWNLKKRLGPLAYVLAGAHALMRKHDLIHITGPSFATSGELILIGNGKFYGGKIPAFPAANLRDGKLEICVFPKITVFKALYYGWFAMNGAFRATKDVKRFSADEFRLTCPDNIDSCLQVDGELALQLPVKISILPRVLRVIVPASQTSLFV